MTAACRCLTTRGIICTPLGQRESTGLITHILTNLRGLGLTLLPTEFTSQTVLTTACRCLTTQEITCTPLGDFIVPAGSRLTAAGQSILRIAMMKSCKSSAIPGLTFTTLGKLGYTGPTMGILVNQ